MASPQQRIPKVGSCGGFCKAKAVDPMSKFGAQGEHRGFMLQLVGKRWRLRWFVLSGGVLRCYHLPQDNKPLQQFEFPPCRAQRSKIQFDQVRNVLEIILHNQQHLFACETNEDLESWLNALPKELHATSATNSALSAGDAGARDRAVARSHDVGNPMSQFGAASKCRGFMLHLVRNSWQLRWCVLSGRVLSCYVRPQDTTPLDQFALSSWTVSAVSDLDLVNNAFQMSRTTMDRFSRSKLERHFFACETTDSRQHWLETFRKAMITRDKSIMKCILIGDPGVGKSNFLSRFADDTFTESWISTTGIDFKFKTLDINETKLKLQVWDTSGQTRFLTITTAYFRGMQFFFLVFDITNAESFEGVDDWFRQSKQRAPADALYCLVGSKLDLSNRRVVDTAQAQAYADEHGMPYFEVSAKTGENVKECFAQAARTFVELMDSYQC